MQTASLELEYLANYLAESTLIDYGFLNFLPSAIAASAVFLARWTLDQSNDPWVCNFSCNLFTFCVPNYMLEIWPCLCIWQNPTLEHYTSYKASDLKIIVLAIQDLQLNTNGCSLHVIRMKYRQQEVTNRTEHRKIHALFVTEFCWTCILLTDLEGLVLLFRISFFSNEVFVVAV